MRQLIKIFSIFGKGTAVMLFLSLFSTVIRSQDLPSYADRAFIITDSSIQKNDDIAVVEGGVDENVYLVGPGDQFKISLDDIETLVFDAKINPDGLLLLPKIGMIKLSGLTLRDAKDKIRAEFARKYKSKNIFVTLSGIRRIKIAIYGEVLKKGSKVVLANSRLNDILMDGGFTPVANIRNIKIISKDGGTKYIDLLSFIRLADRNQNPLLEEGDYIMVDKLDKTVSLSGMVKYPGVYEYKEGETYAELLKIAGGYLDAAFLDTIEVIRFADDNHTQNSIRESSGYLISGGFKLQNKDRIVVRTKPLYLQENIVIIDGFVRYPGPYKITEGVTKLSQIIPEAGGFLEKASMKNSYIIRASGESAYDPEFERIKLIPRKDMTDDEYDYLKSKSRQRHGRIVIDFQKVFRDKTDDLILKKNDQIFVIEKKDYITIIGQAVFPGNLEFNPDFSVRDYINIAGGFAWRAEEGKVRVIKGRTGEWVEEDKVIKLEPGDTIWIPEKPQAPKFWDVFKDTLTILGQLATVIAATVAVIISTR
ncbi:MAG: SLBB domain-containing protein [Ignavibacteria bacterium]|nr:SLBB domain-containing protein [Ignavibacteria bacterium]